MKSNYLHLTGGLGNQLFQWSALLSMSIDKRPIIDVVNGLPRNTPNGKPDLLSFNLPVETDISQKEMMALTRKFVGYSLRSHVTPKNLEKIPLFLCLVRMVTSLLVSCHYRRFVSVRVSTDLGYDRDFKVGRGNNYLIGYFQSEVWPKKILSTSLDHLRVLQKSNLVDKYKELSKWEQPLVVHMRLGDYLDEESFGIPNEEYYRTAINKLVGLNNYNKIWLFSDEPDKALSRLPRELPLEVRIIGTTGLTSAETLEVMRWGSGYIIANSTFSWWGAYLSHSINPKVIFPKPWFRSLQNPALLTPSNWEGVNVYY